MSRCRAVATGRDASLTSARRGGFTAYLGPRLLVHTISEHQHDGETDHADHVDEQVAERTEWARRRRADIPTGDLVVACMDERIPVEDVLGLELGDAQIFRNAGGKVTDDVTVTGYVYEVESGELRGPGDRVAEEISERRV